MDSCRRIAPNILAPFTLRHHARTLTSTHAGLIREQSQGRCDNGHIEYVTPDEGAAPQRFVVRLTVSLRRIGLVRRESRLYVCFGL
jgi:hypothetical protein